jgi:hypothetical protein
MTFNQIVICGDDGVLHVVDDLEAISGNERAFRICTRPV